MTAHHHNFREQDNRNMTSQYNREFNDRNAALEQSSKP